MEVQGNRNLLIYSYSLYFINGNKGNIILHYNFSHYPTLYNGYNYNSIYYKSWNYVSSDNEDMPPIIIDIGKT